MKLSKRNWISIGIISIIMLITIVASLIVHFLIIIPKTDNKDMSIRIEIVVEEKIVYYDIKSYGPMLYEALVDLKEGEFAINFKVDDKNSETAKLISLDNIDENENYVYGIFAKAPNENYVFSNNDVKNIDLQHNGVYKIELMTIEKYNELSR